MKILSVERFDQARLLDAIRRTRLRGHGKPQIYRTAELRCVPATDWASLTPAQNYVLKPGIRTIIELRDALLPFGVDPLALDGGAYVRTAEYPDEVVPVIPPIVEETVEPDGRKVLIISDGLHRVSAARALNLPITVVEARGVPEEFPYYAYALRDGWSEVTELEQLPEVYQKKEYREPENYKALFREYNEVFPGVQKERKRTNPLHLVR